MHEPRRRILLLLEATLGGTGRHIVDLTRGLLQRHYEVHLVYSTIRADRQFLTGLDELRRFSPEFHAYELPIKRSLGLGDFKIFLKLYKYCKQNGPFDLIHGHSTKAGFLARLLCAGARTPRIYSPHALMTMDPNLKGLGRIAVCLLESSLAWISSKVIVVSDDEMICARRTGIPARKLIQIENGVDLARMDLKARHRRDIRKLLGIPEDAACLGYVGRFWEGKNPERVIETFAILREQSARTVKLMMVGFGPLEAKLKNLADQLGCGHDVIWTGEVDGPGYMAAIDVLALCSRFEAFAYVLLEACALGIPFVSTRIGAATALAGKGAGYVCDPWRPEAYAEIVLRIIEDERLLKRLSIAARKTAEEYSLQRMLDRICRLYEDTFLHPAPGQAREAFGVGNPSQ